MSTLQAHTDTAVLPMCIGDVKCADKSNFLLMQIHCFIEWHEVNGQKTFFCQDTTIPKLRYLQVISSLSGRGFTELDPLTY